MGRREQGADEQQRKQQGGWNDECRDRGRPRVVVGGSSAGPAAAALTRRSKGTSSGSCGGCVRLDGPGRGTEALPSALLPSSARAGGGAAFRLRWGLADPPDGDVCEVLVRDRGLAAVDGVIAAPVVSGVASSASVVGSAGPLRDPGKPGRLGGPGSPVRPARLEPAAGRGWAVRGVLGDPCEVGMGGVRRLVSASRGPDPGSRATRRAWAAAIAAVTAAEAPPLR